MIVVTGLGRCGSSLIMQTLNILGVPLVSNPQFRLYEHCLWGGYQRNNPTPIKMHNEQIERANGFNPKGYWELDVYTLIDIAKDEYTEETNGRAVKLIGELFLEATTNKFEKIIMCTRRNIIRQAESMYNLVSLDLEIAQQNRLENIFTSMYEDFSMDDWQSYFEKQGDVMIKKINSMGLPWIEIFFEDIIENPTKEINRLVDLLGLGDVDITEATQNVDKRMV